MSVDANIPTSTDLFGKIVTDLQEGIRISRNLEILGKSKFIEDYSAAGFDMDDGNNFLVLHAQTSKASDSITVQLIGGDDEPKTLDSDGLVVAQLKDGVTAIQFVATKSGKSETKTYGLRGLVKEAE